MRILDPTATGCRHALLRARRSVLGTQHSGLSTQYSLLSTGYPRYFALRTPRFALLFGVALALAALTALGCSQSPPPTAVRVSDNVTDTAPDQGHSASAPSQSSPASDRAGADTSPSAAAPEPNWPMFRGNSQLTGVAAGALPESLTQLWAFQAEDKNESIQSSAAIVDGVVFVGTIGGWLYAINLDDGKARWKFSTLDKSEAPAAAEGNEKQEPPQSSGELAPAIKSSPTVVGGRVYFGDEFGVFHCLDAKTGKRLWKFQTDTGEIVSSANVVGDRVLFASTDANLYCLAVADGKELWRFKTAAGGLESTPAVADGKTFLSGCDSLLRVIDIADGQEVGSLEIGSQTRGSPAVIEDRLFLGHIGSQVLGVDWKKPQIAWQYTHPDLQFEYHSSAAATSELVIIGGRDKMVHALDRHTGEQRWTFTTKGRVDSSPVVVGNRVFVGSQDGNVYGLDVETGKELWRFATGAPVSASPAVAAGRLVIGNEDGKLCCFGKDRDSADKL